MTYDGERAAEDFRKQAQLGAALHSKNLEHLGKTTQAFVANDELLAMWSVCHYLSSSPALRSRQLLIMLLEQMRSGNQPDRPLAKVFRSDWYAEHRRRLLETLIDRYQSQADEPLPQVRPARRDAG